MFIQQNQQVFFRETKPASIRIWHWLVFLFFLATITTVVFASTLFQTQNNISLVQGQVQQNGGSVTEKQALGVAHEYSDKLWILHTYIGYGLCFLLLWRIVAECTIQKNKKLGARIRSAVSISSNTEERKHYLFVQYSYLVFYILFMVMAISGLVLAFEDIAWLKPLNGTAKNIHGVVQYGLYAYILAHIAGAIRADLTKYGGIVSRMINGKVN